jgi:hypothetical protein
MMGAERGLLERGLELGYLGLVSKSKNYYAYLA